MKKQLMSLLLGIFVMTSITKAQGPQRMTAEERVAAAMEKIAALSLTDEQKTKTTVVITDFYNAQQKAMEEMRASGTMDRDAMMAKRKELSDVRDGELKKIFTSDQLKKWIDEVEPSLRSQRQPKTN